MVCRNNGSNSQEPDELTSEYIQLTEENGTFIWSELPAMPCFNRNDSDKSEEEDGSRCIRFFKGINRRFWSILIVFFEICILAAVISGIYMWRYDEKNDDSYSADNIVYSSDDIVMMLVKNKSEWIFEKPENGYNTCCFLDLDFDGSTELISISYDNDTSVTKMKAYHIRNCKLEEIELDGYDEEKGTFDIGQGLELFYSADTNEMLYMAYDTLISDDGNAFSLGSIFMRENVIYRRDYFSESFSEGIYSYEKFSRDGEREDIGRQEYISGKNELFNRFTDLRLRYEWVQCNDLSTLSSHKLAALLLRSYDSFFCDTSGLGLQ